MALMHCRLRNRRAFRGTRIEVVQIRPRKQKRRYNNAPSGAPGKTSLMHVPGEDRDGNQKEQRPESLEDRGRRGSDGEQVQYSLSIERGS